MRDWILGYQQNVAEAGPGVSTEEWLRFASEVTEAPPADLQELYSAFNGGRLPGGVTLFPYSQVLAERSTGEDSTWMFGEQDGRKLVAARKATLASHPGLSTRPEWFERTSADDLTFAAHDLHSNSVKVFPSLQQLLTEVAPPIDMDSFGDLTLARAMRVVEDAIDKVSEKVSSKLGKKKPAAVQAKAPPKAKGKAPKAKAKSPASMKAASTARRVKKPAKTKASKARKPARKVSPKRPVAKKKPVKRPAKKKAARKATKRSR